MDPDGAELHRQGEGGVGFSDTPGPGRDMPETKQVPLSPSLPGGDCGWADSATPSEREVTLGEDGLGQLSWSPSRGGGSSMNCESRRHVPRSDGPRVGR